MQRGNDWCLACVFDRRFCRALRGLRACWHPAFAFGSLACWAARDCGSVSALLAWLTVIVDVQCGNCGTADVLLVCSEVLRAGRRRDGGAAGVLLAWLTAIAARQCGGCGAASLLACLAVLLPGWLMNCQRPVYVLGGLTCWAPPGWLTRQLLACPLGARCWGMVCCVCLAALHRASGGWASCLRQSILTSGFHVWEPMYRRGFRVRRPRSCGSRTERRVARCAVRCTGCFPAWKPFPR